MVKFWRCENGIRTKWRILLFLFIKRSSIFFTVTNENVFRVDTLVHPIELPRRFACTDSRRQLSVDLFQYIFFLLICWNCANCAKNRGIHSLHCWYLTWNVFCFSHLTYFTAFKFNANKIRKFSGPLNYAN